MTETIIRQGAGLRPQRPPMADLLHSVRDYIDSGAAGGDRYQAQVASYLLAICAREAEYGGPRLDDGAAMCAAIRVGDHDEAWAVLIDDLLADTIVTVRVTRPDHLAPDHRETAA